MNSEIDDDPRPVNPGREDQDRQDIGRSGTAPGRDAGTHSQSADSGASSASTRDGGSTSRSSPVDDEDEDALEHASEDGAGDEDEETSTST
jgi:hypothetical protein